MFQPPYKVAVIGRTGRGDYGHSLDLAVLGQPNLTPVAVADEDAKGRAAAAKRLGVPAAYADYREMLDKETPHFAIIGPRWVDCHQEMIVQCAQRGIHIFTEKPLCPDLASADAIVDACDRHHVKLAIAYQTRHSPQYDRVKELLASNAIGEVLEVRGRGKEDRRGGGEDLLVLGSHVMDLFRGVLGEASWCFARVTEKGRPIAKADVRPGSEGLGPLAGDRIDAVYGFPGTPALAHFATSRPSSGPGGRFGITIHGSKGVIELRTGALPFAALLDDPTWSTSSPGPKSGKWTRITSAGLGKPEPLPSSPDGGLVDSNKRILQDLIRAVETDSQPKADARGARAITEMLLACHASQACGGPVNLPLKDRRHPLDLLG